jgi:hypothetical protein
MPLEIGRSNTQYASTELARRYIVSNALTARSRTDVSVYRLLIPYRTKRACLLETRLKHGVKQNVGMPYRAFFCAEPCIQRHPLIERIRSRRLGRKLRVRIE